VGELFSELGIEVFKFLKSTAFLLCLSNCELIKNEHGGVRYQ
jgi:hypothetical protein